MKTFSALAFVGILMFAPAAHAGKAKDVVDEFHGSLLAVMKVAKSLSVKERYGKLQPAVHKAFNLPYMIRLVSGSRWKKASTTHQDTLKEAFSRMSVGTYAFRFDGYSGESFETLKERTGPRNTVLVETQIVRPNDSPVKLTYVTRQFGDTWRIIDVLLGGGISEMAVRVSEYRAVLKSQGAIGLAKALNKKADGLISGN